MVLKLILISGREKLALGWGFDPDYSWGLIEREIFIEGRHFLKGSWISYEAWYQSQVKRTRFWLRLQRTFACFHLLWDDPSPPLPFFSVVVVTPYAKLSVMNWYLRWCASFSIRLGLITIIESIIDILIDNGYGSRVVDYWESSLKLQWPCGNYRWGKKDGDFYGAE